MHNLTNYYRKVKVKLLSHVWLFATPPGSSVHRIFQATVLEWVVISFSRGSSRLRDQIHISYIGRLIIYHGTTWEAWLTLPALYVVCSLL